MADLEAALCVRGRTRKRFLSECHDHLIDLANDVGPDDAAVAFGAPGIVAASFDAEVATSRCARAAWLAAVGVASVGGSTLVLIHSADATAQAAVPWAIAFFVCAQVSAVAMVIGLIQAMSIRHRVVSPADSMLLCRRTAIALVSAAGTMLAAGGALPGRGDPLVLLAGPALAIVAGGVLSRAWWLDSTARGRTFPRRPLSVRGSAVIDQTSSADPRANCCCDDRRGGRVRARSRRARNHAWWILARGRNRGRFGGCRLPGPTSAPRLANRHDRNGLTFDRLRP